jgi:hypothetical protein
MVVMRDNTQLKGMCHELIYKCTRHVINVNKLVLKLLHAVVHWLVHCVILDLDKI